MSAPWSVITIMKEPLQQSLRFAAWYLSQGAEMLIIFFDDPADPALPILSQHPRIQTVACTKEVWERLDIPGDIRFSRRQNMIMTRTYHAISGGWVLFVDGDELLMCNDRRFGDILADQPDDIVSVRVKTAELIRTETPQDETCFRLPMRIGASRAVYQDKASHFARKRFGLVGHANGKSATRSEIPDLRLRQHWAQKPDGTRVAEQEIGPERGAYLLHMYEQGFDNWCAKVEWRKNSRGFSPGLTERIEAALAAPDREKQLRALYRTLHVVDDATLARMEEHGALLRVSLDFEALVAHHFSDIDVGRA